MPHAAAGAQQARAGRVQGKQGVGISQGAEQSECMLPLVVQQGHDLWPHRRWRREGGPVWPPTHSCKHNASKTTMPHKLPQPCFVAIDATPHALLPPCSSCSCRIFIDAGPPPTGLSHPLVTPPPSPYRRTARMHVHRTLVRPYRRSIDVITLPEGEGKPTTDFAKLLSDMPKNCDYSINSQMPAVASKA